MEQWLCLTPSPDAAVGTFFSRIQVRMSGYIRNATGSNATSERLRQILADRRRGHRGVGVSRVANHQQAGLSARFREIAVTIDREIGHRDRARTDNYYGREPLMA
jgi:hypothetical protein